MNASKAISVSCVADISFHVIEDYVAIRRIYDSVYPALIKLAPCGGMTWSRARLSLVDSSPATMPHQTPVADGRRFLLTDIVQVWPTKEEVPELVGANTKRGIFRDG